MWANPITLWRKGILGMNCRNVAYIGRYNPRERYPLVDDKLLTKTVVRKAGVSAPELLLVIRTAERNRAHRADPHEIHAVRDQTGARQRRQRHSRHRRPRRRQTRQVERQPAVACRREATPFEHHQRPVFARRAHRRRLRGSVGNHRFDVRTHQLRRRARHPPDRVQGISGDGYAAARNEGIRRQGEPAPGRRGRGSRHRHRSQHRRGSVQPADPSASRHRSYAVENRGATLAATACRSRRGVTK